MITLFHSGGFADNPNITGATSPGTTTTTERPHVTPNNRPTRRGASLLPLQLAIGAAILGFFGFMSAQLYQREMGTHVGVRKLGISPDLLTVTWVNYDQFMWIYRGDEKVGVYVLQVQRQDDHRSYELISRARLKLSVAGQMVPIRVDLSVMMNRYFEMQTFQGALDALQQKVDMEAFTDGLQFYYRLKGPEALVTNGGSSAHFSLTEPVMLADAIRPVVTQSDRLKEGNKWTTIATDPIAGRFTVPVKVEVVGQETLNIEDREVDVFRVEETAGDHKTTSWYDSEGQVQKSDLGNGLTMVRARQEMVMAQYPELNLPPNFPDIKKQEIRASAQDQKEGEGASPMPWLPSF